MAKELFEDVPSEFKDAVDAESVDDIKKRVARVALDQCALMEEKKKDEDLAKQRELYMEAGAVYKEGTKMNKAKIEYCKMMIENKGGH